jgi:endonuclease-3
MTEEERVRRIFSYFRERAPEPKTELAFRNDYTLLVAVVLSAQATDVSVNKATSALFDVADTPEKMLALGEEGLKSHIRTIGLYNAKARNVIALSRLLIERHASEVPRDLDALQALPGVGRKTARVVMNCAFGMPYVAVDTHVFRVANRLGIVAEKTPEKTEPALERVVPPEFLTHAHHWLILHGRYVCKARKPDCPACGVRQWCAYPHKTGEGGE